MRALHDPGGAIQSAPRYRKHPEGVMAVTRVWIEEGCIVCNACETTCPEVFNVTEESCHIRAEVRADHLQDTNLPAKSPLVGEIGAELADQIEEAAEGCPVEVIKFEKVK
jgi:ferredoxin